MALAKCPKCGGNLHPGVAEPDDPPEDRASACARDGGCRYVACDDLRCMALKTPDTREEWRDAAEHWRSHRYLCGCSHGR